MVPFPILDAHQHFWKYNPQRDGWMTDELYVLRKDYLPEDLEPVYKKNHVIGSVLIQADPSETENFYFLELASRFSFIKGIVGWIDLQAKDIMDRLEYYQAFPQIKGFRHLLQGEAQRDFMLTSPFQRGISCLNKFGYSFDLLILEDQLGYAETLVRNYPDQRFVIDHMAKPSIKKGFIAEWKRAMAKFAPCANVYCKISGMVTEADWQFWEPADFHHYMDAVLEIFGTKRIMFGSDWPVCLVAANYEQVKEIVIDYFSNFSVSEQSDFFANNAVSFYKLT